MALGDQYFDKVVLACSFDAGIVDESVKTKVLTAQGGASISTAQKKFGAASAYFDGAGDYVAITPTDDLTLGNEDFTVELWFFVTGWGGHFLFSANNFSSASGIYVSIYNGGLFCEHNNITCSNNMSGYNTNEWNHVAFTRSGNTYRTFLNGALKQSSTGTPSAVTYDRVSIGAFVANGSGLSEFSGYIDDVRVTKGVARYTTNFTVPASSNPMYAAQLQGTVKDANGNFARRLVRAHRRLDGVVVDETLSDLSTGVFTLNCPTVAKHYAVVHDSDAWITYLPMNGAPVPPDAETDTLWGNVVLAMRMNGVNNSTTFTDAKGKTVTAHNNAVISTAQSKFGGASAYFDGTEDYLKVPSSSDFDFGSDPFTIECWIYPTSLGLNRAFVMRGSADGNGSSSATFLFGSSASYLLGYVSAGGNFNVSLQSSSGVLVANQWQHVAVVRIASDLWRLFHNGVKVGEINGYANPVNASTGPIVIGMGSDYVYNSYAGYIDDVRITKGVARYSSDFSPPSGQIGTGLPMQTFYELSGKTVTPYGSTTLTAAQSKFGGVSAYFNGSSDYLVLPHAPDLYLASGDFTIEFFVRIESITGAQLILDKRQAFAPRGLAIFLDTTGGNKFWFCAGDANTSGWEVALISNTVVTGQFYHLAFCRSGSTFSAFVDGVSVGTATWGGVMSDATADIRIGSAIGGSAFLKGYLDDFRISKGVARYVGSFLPPTTPHFTVQAGDPYLNNVVLGCHFNAGDTPVFKDVVSGKAITANGGATISTAQSKFGGASAYFDGTGDCLSIGNAMDWDFGSADFTVECFVRLETVASAQGIVDKRETLAARGWSIYFDTSGGNKFWFTAGDSNTTAWEVAIGSGIVTTGQFYHLAFCRRGSTFTAFVDGVSVGTATWSGSVETSSTPLLIGALVGPVFYFNGYIDDLRITKGFARYGANFTPPTQAFPDTLEHYGQQNALIYDHLTPV